MRRPQEWSYRPKAGRWRISRATEGAGSVPFGDFLCGSISGRPAEHGRQYPVHTNAVDASYRPDTTDTEDAPPAQEDKTAEAVKEPFDEELSRFVNMFKLARESGYTLKLVPGTPEENAPVFDFAAEAFASQKAA